MANKGNLKRTLILSISASVFLIAAVSFAGVIWAGDDGRKADGQQHLSTDLYSLSLGGTPTPTSTPTATPTITATATPTPTQTPTGPTFSLTSNAYETNEGYTAVIGVNRSPWTMGGAARVTSSDGSAVGGTACTPGVDYITIDRYVSYGGLFDTYRQVVLATCPDAIVESDETVQINLIANVAGWSQAILTIHAGAGTPTPSPSPTPTPTCGMSYSYSSLTPVVVDDYRDPNEPGQPAPYPFLSTIQVTDPLLIASVSVRLLGVNHGRADDLDLLLVGPGGENVIIMSDVGGNGAFAGVDVIIGDNAPVPLPDEEILTAGFFRPTNIGAGDTFLNAPVPSGGSALSVFEGTLSDGIWSLYVIDDSQGGVGSIPRGWEITFNVCPTGSPTPTPTPTTSPTPTTINCSPSGVLDTTFSVDGKVTNSILGPLEEAYSIALQPDGKIVAGGKARNGGLSYFGIARYMIDGSLDTTFAGDGTVATSFSGDFNDSANSVAIQPDGKIVAVGEASLTEFGFSDFALVRYLANGLRDTSFDGDGKVTTDLLGNTDVGRSVAIQPDGKIVVAGYSYINSDRFISVARYLADGSLDPAFDEDGKVTTAISEGYDEGQAVAIQPDGKIIVAGSSDTGPNDDFALVRYNPDGSLDASFDRDGIVTTPIGTGSDVAYSLAIQPDGRIIAAGTGGGGFAVVRYNADGSLDTSFSDDGKVTTSVLTWHYSGSVAVQQDGRIVVAGTAYTSGSTYQFALVRYNTDGRLDTSFDEDGKLTTDFNNTHDYAFSILIQPDGRIVAAGSSSFGNTGNLDFALARYGEPCQTSSSLFDYDADGRADISVFRPSDGSWYLNRSRDGFYAAQFGVGTDRVAPADYDGDGKADIAVYRPSAGTWFIFNSSSGAVSYNVFGVAEDLPAPADYDGDGKADVSVYRPSTGTWYRQNSFDGSFFAVQFGVSEDKPTIGDFDGDGKADIGVYRPSTSVWYQIRSSDGSIFAEQFGIPTDKLVPADYDGDGKTDLAVYRSSTGIWYIRNSSGITYSSYAFGLAEDVPAPGDYDGDGKADLAVFRPSAGTWYIANSGNGSFTISQWGLAGDIPTPAAFRY